MSSTTTDPRQRQRILRGSSITYLESDRIGGGKYEFHVPDNLRSTTSSDSDPDPHQICSISVSEFFLHHSADVTHRWKRIDDLTESIASSVTNESIEFFRRALDLFRQLQYGVGNLEEQVYEEESRRLVIDEIRTQGILIDWNKARALYKKLLEQ